MQIKKIERNGVACTVIQSEQPVLTDAQSAVDMLMTARYEADTKNLVIDKALVAEDFFILSTGLAGEALQKLINYGGRIAIFGDFSRYTSKPLRDFIRESNRGRDVFFVPTEAEGVEMLTRRAI
ncbi:MAG: DUF4180 domain-containing protein [Clostridia bacterium]|nr:DUF4180 domain-containing protein [Clostridia bacterium]